MVTSYTDHTKQMAIFGAAAIGMFATGPSLTETTPMSLPLSSPISSGAGVLDPIAISRPIALPTPILVQLEEILYIFNTPYIS
jgi:hypothetical protein